MAIEKNIGSRIQQKYDIESNWNKAENFIPKLGEIIIYGVDSTHNYVRIKIGNGTTTVKNLPFIDDHVNYLPEANNEDADKFLRVNSNGQPYWATVLNAEEGSF